MAGDTPSQSSNGSQIRILLTDDHEIVRKGLVHVLTQCDRIDIAGQAATAEEALEALQKDEYDLVILDISMPGLSGLEALERIQETRPGQPVLILSMYDETHFAIRAIRQGARGYVTKSTPVEELIAAVLKVAEGGSYIAPMIAEAMVEAMARPSDQPSVNLLTKREYEVFIKLAEGWSVSEIANQLGLNVKTISTNRARILKKLQLKNNAEIIRYGIKHGLVALT